MKNNIGRIKEEYGKCDRCSKIGVKVIIVKFGKEEKCCSKCAAKLAVLYYNVTQLLKK
jgi:hypothetical protein